MMSVASTEALSERRDRVDPASRATAAKATVAGKENGRPVADRPRVWKRAKDPRTGRTYYYDVHTRETQWEKPLELASPEERERIENKDRELKSFFATMEQNILRRVNEGLDVHDVQPAPAQATTSPLQAMHVAMENKTPALNLGLEPAANRRTATPLDIGVPATYKKTEDTKHQAYPEFWGAKPDATASIAGLGSGPPMRMVRTISHMDDSVLEQLKSTENEDLSAQEARDLEDMAEEEAGVESPTEDGQAPEPRGLLSMKTAPLSRKRHSLMSVFFKNKPKAAVEKKPRRRSTIRQRPKLDAAPAPTRTSMASVDVDSLGAAPPPLRRNNSTSTIYVNETMAAPDKESTIKVVCCVIRAHMLSAAARDDAHNVDTVPSQFRIFVDRDYVRPQQRRPSFSRHFVRGTSEEEVEVPKLDTLVQFFRHVYLTAQMEVECIIMSLIYIEKLLKDTTGALQIRHFNWKSVLFAGMILASKVWDDLSMWNVDFSAVCPSFSLRRINDLELALLSLLKFNTTITASVYAKYYFHLRSMCATMGLGGDLREMQPLCIEDAQRLHISSKNYADRNALKQPAAERASTLSEGLTQARIPGDSSEKVRHRKSSSSKPALSLEEVVTMHSPTTRSGHSSVRSAEGSVGTVSAGTRSTASVLTP